MNKKQGSQLATAFSSKKLLKKENIFFACGQTISHRLKDPVNQFMNSTITFFICRKMFIIKQRKTLRVEYSSLSPYMLYGSSENGRTTNSWLNMIKLWNKKLASKRGSFSWKSWKISVSFLHLPRWQDFWNHQTWMKEK